MKKQRSNEQLIILLLLVFFAGASYAQSPTYSASLENDLMVSSNIYEFDLYLARTGSTPLELANFQAAIGIDPGFVNGGVITPSIISGTSELNTSQWPISIAFSQSQNTIKIAPRTPPRTLFPDTETSSTNGTIIEPEGTRVCRIRLENSVDFSSGLINPVWNFTLNPYRTAVTAYVGPTDHKVNTFITLEESHSKTLNLAVMTEGLFDGSTGIMRKAQDADADFNTWDNFPGLVADTITIQLAETSSPWNIVHSVHGVNLNTDGSCRIYVPGYFSGNYYVIFKHRNSIETWSKPGGESFVGNSTSFCMNTDASQAFGSNLKQVAPGKFAIFTGDVAGTPLGTQDGYIELPDLNSIYNLSLAGAYGYQKGDLNGDGFVELPDLNMVFNNSLNGVGMNTPPNPAGKKKH